jgi:HD-GYP domain-containing protein (c-di-GMP phosphodiesterase class II)
MTNKYHDLVILITRGISQRKMYFDDHPRVRACAEEFTRSLAAQLDEDGKEKFFIGVANGKLVHEGKYLIGPSIIGNRLTAFAELTGTGGFLFSRGVTSAEIQEFFAIAAGQSTKLEDLAEARRLLHSRNIKSIELSPPYENAGWFGQFLFDSQDNGNGPSDQDAELNNLLSTFQSLYSTVEEAIGAGRTGRGLDLDRARNTSDMLMKAADGQVHDIMQLIRYPDYDTYTVGHCVRVAMFAVMVGRRLQLPEPQLNELGVSALLHDVGKGRIPQEILYKPGRLDERERAIIEQHPQLGVQILLESSHSSEMAIAAAWGHHRRYDRKGYPKMTIPSREGPISRIINVCDVYEALTAIRPYKKALTGRKALEIMLADEGWFCPSALSAFCGAVGLYPAGSRVLLDDGHQAKVLAQSGRFDRPLVKITHGPDGCELAEVSRIELDLSTRNDGLRIREQLIAV